MIYNDFQDKKLSALGMGTMRLPVVNGNDAEIDEAATAEMVEYAMQNGVNYYDTAWGYHRGNSELVMGRVLKKYPRESFYLASKFPGYDLSNMNKVEEIFEKQLEKCQVEYFDFYLVHNVCELNINQYLDPQYRIYAYLTEQKRNGRIKHLGFSAHGECDVINRCLEVYGKDMEFGQLQLNWIDWDFHDSKKKVEILEKHNIPVWVMDPLRGGSLANIAENYEKQLNELRPDESVPAWAFRFLQTIPSVKVTLSGMSNFDQLKKNIDTYKENKPLSDEEFKTLLSIAKDMTSKKSVPCTACRYCVEHCPQQLDIPKLLALYNEHSYTGGGFIAPMVLSTLDDDKKPSSCLGCGSCEAVCPQQIKISEALADFASKF